jgi:hypothetical protein
MPSSIQAYSVSIANSKTTVAPADGFVDNKAIESFGVSLAVTGSLSYPLCQAKMRGNVRYRAIIGQLQMVANCYVDAKSITSNSTAITEGATFGFQLYAEHGPESLSTADELVAGQRLIGHNCIKRCIARALSTSLVTNVLVYDPTSAVSLGALGATKSVPRFGMRSNLGFAVDAYEPNLTSAAALVTVTVI